MPVLKEIMGLHRRVWGGGYMVHTDVLKSVIELAVCLGQQRLHYRRACKPSSSVDYYQVASPSMHDGNRGHSEIKQFLRWALTCWQQVAMWKVRLGRHSPELCRSCLLAHRLLPNRKQMAFEVWIGPARSNDKSHKQS